VYRVYIGDNGIGGVLEGIGRNNNIGGEIIYREVRNINLDT
jgi:hypothetical protein|tara:strand:- start:97 stop:219 length:123 start_codon:yes stop_codon:yes gene_type:complete